METNVFGSRSSYEVLLDMTSVYWMNEKCRAKPTSNESTPQYRRRVLQERRTSAVWFPSYGLLKMKFSCRLCSSQGFWNSSFFHHVCLGLFTTISYETSLRIRCKVWVCRLGFIYGSCVTVLTTFFLAVREFFNNLFPEQRIGRGGPTAWPLRSPDLNTLDFYLRGHLKSTVCATEVSAV